MDGQVEVLKDREEFREELLRGRLPVGVRIPVRPDFTSVHFRSGQGRRGRQGRAGKSGLIGGWDG